VEQGRYDELLRLGGVFAELDARGRFVADAAPEIAASFPAERMPVPMRSYG
jgi:hypothetical protein